MQTRCVVAVGTHAGSSERAPRGQRDPDKWTLLHLRAGHCEQVPVDGGLPRGWCDACPCPCMYMCLFPVGGCVHCAQCTTVPCDRVRFRDVPKLHYVRSGRQAVGAHQKVGRGHRAWMVPKYTCMNGAGRKQQQRSCHGGGAIIRVDLRSHSAVCPLGGCPFLPFR